MIRGTEAGLNIRTTKTQKVALSSANLWNIEVDADKHSLPLNDTSWHVSERRLQQRAPLMAQDGQVKVQGKYIQVGCKQSTPHIICQQMHNLRTLALSGRHLGRSAACLKLRPRILFSIS